MNRSHQVHRSGQRNAGLRRLRRINRALAVTTVALTLLFANAAARTFRGHARTVKAAPSSAPSPRDATIPTSAARAARHHPRAHRARSHRTASSQSTTAGHSAPSTTTAAAAPNTAASPVLSPPDSAPQASASAPAPAPVVSGGS